MDIIRGTELLPENIDKNKLKQAAQLHQRYGSITFSIESVTDNTINIHVVQGKNFHENYVSEKRLMEIVYETFSGFLPGKEIKVKAELYVPVTSL